MRSPSRSGSSRPANSPKIPTPCFSRSISGKRSVSPERRIACSTVVPAGTRSPITCCVCSAAQAISIRSIAISRALAVELHRTLVEAVHELVRDSRKHRREHHADEPVRDLELEIERDTASTFVKRVEAPETLEIAERSVEQPDVNHLVLLVQVTRGEGLVHASIAVADRASHSALVPRYDARAAAPRQELRIRRDVMTAAIDIAYSGVHK